MQPAASKSRQANRRQMLAIVVRDRNPPFVKLADGSIRNGYTVRILNLTEEPRCFRIAVEDLPGAKLEVASKGAVLHAPTSVDVAIEAERLHAVRLYVATPDKHVRRAKSTEFDFAVTEVTASNPPETGKVHAIFNSPGE